MKEWVDFRGVKWAVPMEAVLSHYRVRGLRRQRDQLQGPCPLHRGERQDSFRVRLSQNAFHCFSCQAKGNVLDFVAAMESCSLREAALRLQHWFGVSGRSRFRLTLPSPPSVPANAEQAELVREKREGGNPVLGFRLRSVDGSHSYLRQRGIEQATAVEFGVGMYLGPGLMSGRIVIPIGNERGEIVAYAGRAWGDQLPKYKLPAGFQKGWELFNLHRALATRQKTVIVVEGYFDCMKVHQAGFPNVVALMGCSLSPVQAQVLREHFERVILMLDGDEAGRHATEVIHHQLAAKTRLVVIPVCDGMQPDQLSSPVIKSLLCDVLREQLATGEQEFPRLQYK
jgi:DNA primase